MLGEDERKDSRRPGSREAREEWGGGGENHAVWSCFVPQKKVEDKAIVFVHWLCIGFVLFLY